MSDMEYTINGSDMQVVDFLLHPGQTIHAEPGLMLYMDQGIDMSTGTGGIMSGIKRWIGGADFFLSEFTQQGHSSSHVGFAAMYPGKIKALSINQGPAGTFLCQKDSFICKEDSVQLEVAFTKKLRAGFFGGDGFILQKLSGQGLAFIQAGGHIIEKQLAAGETLRVDTGALVAFSSTVEYSVTWVKGVKNILFGQEGLFLTQLKGPGTVYLQSLTLSRLVDRIACVLGPSNNNS